MEKERPHSLILPAHLRAAAREDAPALAYLINEAGEGLPHYFWQKNEAGIDAWQHGIERAARDEGDFSWRNAYVVVRDDRVVAMVLGFVVTEQNVDPGVIPALVYPLAQLEQQAVGSWYINALATLPECRGQGLGTELLALAHALAFTSGCKTLSLQNFTNNSRARRLYEREGFRETARLPMPPVQGLPDFGDSILHERSVDPDRAAPFIAPTDT